MSTPYDSDDSDDDHTADGWEDDDQDVSCPCIVCAPTSFPSAADCVAHMTQVHGLDILLLKKDMEMNFYGYLRLVNYLRTPSSGMSAALRDLTAYADVLRAVKGKAAEFRGQDAFLKPVVSNDPLLRFPAAMDADGDDDGSDEDEDDDVANAQSFKADDEQKRAVPSGGDGAGGGENDAAAAQEVRSMKRTDKYG